MNTISRAAGHAAKSIRSIQMICRVCPGGQKLTSAAVEYAQPVDGSCITAQSYVVYGGAGEEASGAASLRTVTRAYTSLSAQEGAPAPQGRFVIIELDEQEPEAELTGFDRPGPDAVFIRRAPALRVQQAEELRAADGGTLPAWEAPVDAAGEIEPVVDRFTQHMYHSACTGRELPYNLFLPKDYREDGSYPLVLYIHDRGPLSFDVKTTLRQGIGALAFACDRVQEKDPCIVLAPQYARVPMTDGEPDMLETTFDLYEDIMDRYAVDRDRLYTTGQSMGCMSSIGMGIRRPDFFTAFLLVAGQWDPEAMLALCRMKALIIVSRGDPRAYAGMNESLALMEQHGARVERAEWDQDGGIVPPEQVDELLAREANIRYAVLKTEDRDFHCHMDTWKVAYGIDGAIDWLLAQRRDAGRT